MVMAEEQIVMDNHESKNYQIKENMNGMKVELKEVNLRKMVKKWETNVSYKL